MVLLVLLCAVMGKRTLDKARKGWAKESRAMYETLPQAERDDSGTPLIGGKEGGGAGLRGGGSPDGSGDEPGAKEARGRRELAEKLPGAKWLRPSPPPSLPLSAGRRRGASSAARAQAPSCLSPAAGARGAAGAGGGGGGTPALGRRARPPPRVGGRLPARPAQGRSRRSLAARGRVRLRRALQRRTLAAAAAVTPPRMSVVCAHRYWAVVVLNLPILALLTAVAARGRLRTHRSRVQMGYAYVEGDVEWDVDKVVRLPALVCVGAIAAGMLGVGGGMILGPIFTELGFLPEARPRRSRDAAEMKLVSTPLGPTTPPHTQSPTPLPSPTHHHPPLRSPPPPRR